MITEKIGKLIEFNPSEALFVGSVAKKIAMEKLVVGERKIKGYDYGVFSSGAKFRNGDTLLAKITPCLENGKTALVDILEDDEIAFGSTEFIVLRETEFIDKDYLFYLARSPHFRQLAISSMEGTSGRKRVAESALQSREITIPKDKKEQQKIANILSSLDEKIELNNKIISELEQMAKELYDYWFVQFDFPDANGKPYRSSGGKITYNPTLKREIPDGWENTKLQDIANITMGQSPDGSSYNENGDGMIFYQGSTDFGNIFPSVRQYTNEPTRYAKKGDILMSVRAPVGTLNFAKDDCCIGRGLAALNSKTGSIVFLYQILCDLKIVFDRRNTDGTTFGSITKDDLFSLNVIAPENCVLNSFDYIANDLINKIFICAKENQELARLRDWLLPMLMNGQVTVQTDAKEETKSQQRNQQFELWLSNQGAAARGEIDKATLREIFDAMDEDDK